MADPFRLRLAKLIAGKHWPDDEAVFFAMMDSLPEHLVLAIHDALTGEPMLTQTPVWFEEW